MGGIPFISNPKSVLSATTYFYLVNHYFSAGEECWYFHEKLKRTVNKVRTRDNKRVEAVRYDGYWFELNSVETMKALAQQAHADKKIIMKVSIQDPNMSPVDFHPWIDTKKPLGIYETYGY